MEGRDRKILVAIITISVIVRVCAALYLGNQVQILPGTHDQISYHTLATRILGGFGLTFAEYWWPATPANTETAHWSYLYLGYLAGIYRLFGVNPIVARLFQAIAVGILQPYLAFLIGQRVFNRITGLASAALTAFYGYFIYYAGSLMTESFYIVAIMSGLLIAIQISDQNKLPEGERVAQLLIKWGFGLGIVSGIAILLRQLYLLVIPILFAWIIWRGGKKQFTAIITAGVTMFILILPFTFFNYSRFNRLVLLNTNAGFAFFWGNHPIYGNNFEPILPESMGSYQELIPEEIRDLDEAALDQALLARGLRFVIADPVRYLRLSISRIPPYFIFWPSRDSGVLSNVVRVGSFGVLLPFILYGMIRSYSQRIKPVLKQPLGLLYLYVIFYTAIHLLTWTLIRYRLPVDAILIIFAGYGLSDLIIRIPQAREWLQQASEEF